MMIIWSVMTFLKVGALAFVAMLALGCSSAATSTSKPPPSPGPLLSPGCTTSAAKGRCGPYDGYRQIIGTTSSTYIGNNVWNPILGARQTLSANDPGDWQVTANLPVGNSAVVSYPSIGANYGQITDVPTPLTSYSSIHSLVQREYERHRRHQCLGGLRHLAGAGQLLPSGFEMRGLRGHDPARLRWQRRLHHCGLCLLRRVRWCPGARLASV